MKNRHRVSRNRRRLLKGLLALPFISSYSAAAGYPRILPDGKSYLSEEAIASLKNLNGVLPKGRVGKHEISRLVLGCNPMGGWSHSRDLPYVGELSKRWHSEAKMKETWALAEQAGINLCNLVEFQYKAFNEYKKETGSNMLNNNQCSFGRTGDPLDPFRKAVDDGSDLIYIHGQNTDRLTRSGNTDLLHKALEYVRSQGLPAGVGAHSLKSIETSIRAGVKPDYYFKTFHHDNYWSATPRENRSEYLEDPGEPVRDHNRWNDNMWDQFPERTVELFQNIDVPFFGFKVLAAGAIPPAEGLRWAFENGADFVCLGMYDFQVVDDVNLTLEILEELGERPRPWCA